MKNLFDSPYRQSQDYRLREFINNNYPLPIGLHFENTIDLCFKLAEINFHLDRSIMNPKEVVHGFTGEVITKPLVYNTLNMDEIKQITKGLMNLVKPSGKEEFGIFYYLLITKGHFFEDSNGRIARIIAASVLGLDKKVTLSLVSQNYEVREWIGHLEGDDILDPILRFQTLYNSAISESNRKEFIRILKGELPENLREFKPNYEKRDKANR